MPAFLEWLGDDPRDRAATVLVGHSVGCQTIARALAQGGPPVEGCLLVAPWFWLDEDERDETSELWATPFDYAAARAAAGKVVALLSTNDPFTSDWEANGRACEERLGAEVVVEPGAEHFTREREPKVLELLLERFGRPAREPEAHATVMRLYRIPFSTNVERVALALAHKGLEVEPVDVDPNDRSPIVAVSGQSLVPVLEDEGRVVSDSTNILEYLEERYPDPPLYPRDPARRAECVVFVDWFNRVWKAPPNAITDALAALNPDRTRIAELGAEMAASLDVFEGMLTGRDYLLGEFSAADCAAFPFLKYALLHDPEDEELFHRVLVENLPLGVTHPQIGAWIRAWTSDRACPPRRAPSATHSGPGRRGRLTGPRGSCRVPPARWTLPGPSPAPGLARRGLRSRPGAVPCGRRPGRGGR